MAGYELSDPLETERLLLRPYADRDFEPLYAMRSNADVARYLYWEPQSTVSPGHWSRTSFCTG